MKLKKFTSVMFSLVIGMLVLSGCPPKKKLAIEEKAAEEKVEEVNPEPTPTPTPVVEKKNEIQINQDWTEIPALEVIAFDYDSATLNDSARASLKKNVGVIKKLPATVTIRVEGHCDDRGTVEYNIALGQRRANAVRSYYVTAGVAKKRLETISFGEERPVCKEETESCWARNRRGATKVRNAQPISIDPAELQ